MCGSAAEEIAHTAASRKAQRTANFQCSAKQLHGLKPAFESILALLLRWIEPVCEEASRNNTACGEYRAHHVVMSTAKMKVKAYLSFTKNRFFI